MTPDFLDEVERQLVEATEQVGRRHRFSIGRFWLRIPTFAGVLAIGAVATATAIAATVAIPAITHTSAPAAKLQPAQTVSAVAKKTAVKVAPATVAPATAPATAPSGPVPAGFQPESFTAIGELSWWLLGTAPCRAAPCTSIVRTDNGGRSFVGMPAPRSSAVDELRFANSDDGYAFGSQLWVTYDQGTSWSKVAVAGNVSDLEASDGYVVALVQGARTSWLLRTPVGVNDWKRIPLKGQPVGRLSVQGSDVVVETQTSSKQWFAISSDGGTSFQTYVEPPPNVACDPQAMLPTIWAPCATGTLSGLWRSTNGGASFKAISGTSLSFQEPNSAAFAAATDETAVWGYKTLHRTTNGGRNYTSVAAPKGLVMWRYLGFTDATHGVAIGEFADGAGSSVGRLYYTTDAGRSYHYVPIEP